MATFNDNAATNNINPVVWSWSTTIEYRTDRPAGAFAQHALVDSVQNLGVGVAQGDPFTLLD